MSSVEETVSSSLSEERVDESLNVEVKQKEKKREVITTLKNMDMARQSIPMTKIDGVNGEIRRHIDFTQELLVSRDPDVTTLYENWRNGADNWPDYPCFGTKIFNSDVFEYDTYAEVDKKLNRLSSFLVKQEYGEGEHVGIFGKNCAKWVMVAEACNFQKMVSVALYETLGEENLEFVVNHAELKIIFGDVNKLVDLLTTVENLEFLEVVVPFYSSEEKEGKISEEQYNAMIAAEKKLTKLAAKREIELITWEHAMKVGKKYPAEPNPPSPEDLAILMYTSGTTGNPKGVMILHGNLMSAIDAGYLQLGGLFADRDSYLSYLPLAHIFERVCIGAVVQNGCKVGFYSGDPLLLTQDIGAFKPSLLAGVPRVFDKIHQAITTRVDSAGGISKLIFKSAYKDREKAKAKGKKSKSIFDGVAFKKAQKALGGNVRLIISGGAPLSKDTHQFVSTVFDCPVLQGYGLTETCASANISCPLDKNFGQVGPPTPCCEIKLVSIPEMNYFVTDEPCSKGEVWIRGPSISQGYYKDPEKTAEDFDEEGWFHSGDVGMWNENGTLSIIDRKKNIFKLAQGEYVAAEALELLYNQNSITSQLWIYGNSEESYLVAVAVVNEEHVRGMDPHTEKLEDICKNPEIIDAVLEQCNNLATQHNKAGFERIKKITLYHEEWTTGNDLATPTMKLKRPQLRIFFQEDIDRMYQEIHEEASSTKKRTLNIKPIPSKKGSAPSRAKSSRGHKSSRRKKFDEEPVPEKKKTRRKSTETPTEKRRKEEAAVESVEDEPTEAKKSSKKSSHKPVEPTEEKKSSKRSKPVVEEESESPPPEKKSSKRSKPVVEEESESPPPEKISKEVVEEDSTSSTPPPEKKTRSKKQT